MADTDEWRRCLSKPYPRWPKGDVLQEAVIVQDARAERLNRSKTDCGLEAVTWIESTKREYGK